MCVCGWGGGFLSKAVTGSHLYLNKVPPGAMSEQGQKVGDQTGDGCCNPGDGGRWLGPG